MKELFTELNIILNDGVLAYAKQQAPVTMDNKMSVIDFSIGSELLGEELSQFLLITRFNIKIVSVIGNYHVPWQKNKKTTIRIPIRVYDDSVEFLTEAPKTDKDTMFNNKFRTYKIPYEYGRPYLLSTEYFHTVINYSDAIRHVIDVQVDMSYSEALAYFEDRCLVLY